jgi:hypothetical protein
MFSHHTLGCLEAAGWHTGRRVSTELYQHALRAEGYPIHYPRVLNFLSTHGGLRIEHPHHDGGMGRETLRIDPKQAFRLVTRSDVKGLTAAVGEDDACLLGTARSATMGLVMTSSGRVYGISGSKLWRVSATGPEAIEALCDNHSLIPVK